MAAQHKRPGGKAKQERITRVEDRRIEAESKHLRKQIKSLKQDLSLAREGSVRWHDIKAQIEVHETALAEL